ncbi:PadR family transcriptional regulator [Gulosibacter sp. 10]|uniref:PadR family transcriptional regulator n=1 Tax=Gulosibacter sp. 10 TaxID=1255570 RepID=UPI00097F5815|nr:PadR family transcriptional regulator [Gulosibacter sp. 10]SJM63723.1 Transcriptional regulator, PadR family [Gulosibacter sp. 10]
MSVKHALLALLHARPSSTYRLRKRFDESAGQSVPLNIGQASSTLQRLERDGLVTRAGEDEEEGGGQRWLLTDAGREELERWWRSPVIASQRGRDELVVKLALAAITPGVDVAALVQSQRAATQRTMHDLTRLRRDADREDLVGRLVLDHHLFIGEAELRWLDDVEATLAQAGRTDGHGAADHGATDRGSRAEEAPGRAPRERRASGGSRSAR